MKNVLWHKKNELSEKLWEYFILVDTIEDIWEKIIEINKQNFDVQIKDDKTKLTIADELSNMLLMKCVEQHFPTYKIISEEIENDTLTNDITFIIDPLDGTNDFVNKTWEFSIMLSVLENKKPIFGIVYSPTDKKLIFALDGKWTYIYQNGNLKKLEIQKKEKQDYIMLTSRNYFSETDKKFCQDLWLNEKNYLPCWSIWLKVLKICEGKNDFYMNHSKKLWIWDLAPNDIILREAWWKIYDETCQEIKIIYDTTSKKVMQKIAMCKEI